MFYFPGLCMLYTAVQTCRTTPALSTTRLAIETEVCSILLSHPGDDGGGGGGGGEEQC